MRKYESIRPLDGANGDLDAAWWCRMDDVTSRGAKKPGRRARASRRTECLLRCKLLPCSVLFCPTVPPAVTPGRSNIRSYKTCTSAPSERSPRSNLTSLRPATVANATRYASAHTLGGGTAEPREFRKLEPTIPSSLARRSFHAVPPKAGRESPSSSVTVLCRYIDENW